jgi:hypothetical protein
VGTKIYDVAMMRTKADLEQDARWRLHLDEHASPEPSCPWCGGDYEDDDE